MKNSSWKVVYFAVLLLVVPKKAFAMHIMEGFLPIEWAIFWWAITLPFLILGFRSIRKSVEENPETKMMLGLSGAFAFVLSALKIPSVTGSCSHPTGVGLGTILFGPFAMTVDWIYRTFIPSFITRPWRINNTWRQCFFHGRCRTDPCFSGL